MGKKALIVFQEPWLSYTPSLINLYKCLKKDGYHVDLVGFYSEKFGKAAEVEHVAYIPEIKRLSRIVNAKAVKLARLYHHVRKFRNREYDLVFGADDIGFLAARFVFEQTIFFSLELWDSIYLKWAHKIGINDLIIQTQERKDILMKGKEKNVYYIQNSPIYKDYALDVNKENKKKLLYFGSIVKSFGVMELIGALYHLEQEYTMELHGVVSDAVKQEIETKFQDLFEAGRLKITNQYIEQDEIVDYISRFDIGFTLYDLKSFKNNYNFITCPSGKLFNYYTAGLPVIGSDVSGLCSIREFHAGITVKNLDSGEIARAVEKISSDYTAYRKNSLEAAKKFDFAAAYEQFQKEYAKK